MRDKLSNTTWGSILMEILSDKGSGNTGEQKPSPSEFAILFLCLVLGLRGHQGALFGEMIAGLINDGSGSDRAYGLLELAIDRAPENPYYASMCAHAVSELSHLGKPLPENLASLCAKVLRGEVELRTPNGRPSLKLRDAAIADAISALLRHYPELKATRSPTAETDSACSIVAKALQHELLEEHRAVLSERSIEGIWANHSKDGSS